MGKSKFLKLSTWKMIINSRLIAYKNSKEPWCKERLKICDGCKFNTINKTDRSLKDKFLMFIQITKSVCSICGCNVRYKASVPMASCSREEIGLEPLWRAKEN